MRRSTFFLRTTCLFALFLTAALRAEQLEMDLNPAQTKIGFVVSDVLHTVHGTFQLKKGRISFDPSTGVIVGDITVDAASGSSGSAMRDRRMMRDILEVRRYPEVRFNPTAYTGSVALTGTSSIEVTGSLLIHGHAHEIKLPMQIQRVQQEIIATGKFTVPYVQWGMKNPSTFLLKVNDKVEIDFTAVGRVNGPRIP